MDAIQKEVRRVGRRLALREFFFALGWCWFVALSVLLIVMAVARFYPLPVRDGAVAAATLGVGLLAALFLTWRRSPRVLAAAWEIDRRFELKERVSSTLAMNSVERESDAGKALVADADARLKRLNLGERFSLTPPRQLFLPLAPAALALLLALRPAATRQLAAETIDPPEQQAEIKKTVTVLRERLNNERQKTDKSDVAASELLKKIEEGAKEILAQPSREKALVKLNQLENLLKDRQKQLGGVDAVKKQLEQLKSSEPGPADKLAKALARGDFKQAADALEKLKQELAKSNLDEKQKQALAKEMDQLKNKLEKMAQQASDARADLQQRADKMSSEGDAASAQKLQDQIDQMMQKPQTQGLQQLSDALGQCAQSLKKGQKGDAQQAMQQALNQLKNMAKDSQELATVDNAMKQIADARNRMNCKKCGGAGKDSDGDQQGDEAGSGQGKQPGEGKNGGDGQQPGEGENGGGDMLAGQGEGADDPNHPPGPGMGRGKGNGARPDSKADGKFYDSPVKQKVGKGAAMVTDMVEGPNLKGQAMAEIQKESTAVQQGSTDPLSGQRLPKEQAKFAREYFDRVREDSK
jgi:hypothetical protein